MFRVTMKGNFRDFETIKEALVFIEANWKEDTYLADIKTFNPNSNCIARWGKAQEDFKKKNAKN